MPVLPSYGACSAAFFLAYSARLSGQPTFLAWIRSARSKPSYLAAATDMEKPAEALIGLGLVKVGASIELTPQLIGLSYTADRATLVGFARLLLKNAPPVWLKYAVENSTISREYIPSEDLEALAWLEPDLDEILLDTRAYVDAAVEDLFRKRMGDAAEEYLMAAFRFADRRPTHVAKLSAAYGYDIELANPADRIEVKAASEKTAGRYFLTRNEFEKRPVHNAEWRLLQVVFGKAAFVADRLNAGHVEGVYQLDGSCLDQIVPADTNHFSWQGTVDLRPPSESWLKIDVTPDPTFSIAGFA